MHHDFEGWPIIFKKPDLMCYFISVAVSEKDAEDFLAAVPRGFTTYSRRNPSVTQHVPKHFTEFLLVSGGCSCGLFFCDSIRQLFEGEQRKKTEQLRRKYAKLKWSDAKVERAIASSVARIPDHIEKTEGYDQRVRELIAAFVEGHGEVKIITHFYASDVASEKFDVKQGPTMSPSDFRNAKYQIGEDELVTVTEKT